MTLKASLSTKSTLSQLLQQGSLSAALTRVAGDIRREPSTAAHRLLYFDLLCLTGAFEKALPQLQAAVSFDASLTPMAYVYRQLLQAELFRASVFAGRHAPSLPEASPAWLSTQVEALHAGSSGNTALADQLRKTNLVQFTESAGEAKLTSGEHSFRWIADSDSRLGPVLEVYVQGRYMWLPFSQVLRIDIQPPRSLRDLLWLPATLALSVPGMEECIAFVPGRYPGSEKGGDFLALGRETRWQDVGETAVTALGQKTFISDGADLPLYDVRRLTMSARP